MPGRSKSSSMLRSNTFRGEEAEKFQSPFAREADRRRQSSTGGRYSDDYDAEKERNDVPSSWVLHRLLRRVAAPRLDTQPDREGFPPTKGLRKQSTGNSFISSFLTIEAAARELSLSGKEDLLMLAVSRVAGPIVNKKTLTKHRWMHSTHDGVEFDAFLKKALKASGVSPQVEAGIISKFSDRIFPTIEKSAFGGRSFFTNIASTEVESDSNPIRICFMAMPFFLLANTQKRSSTKNSSIHWIQGLVQSSYHLDSSIAREKQQAVCQLHNNISEVLHVPQLWILTVGDKFMATCAPTTVYDNQSSSITTCMLSRHIFPPSICVTLHGVIFCLQRDQCTVWFEFLHRVHDAVKEILATNVDPIRCSYMLEKGNKPIQGREWTKILQSFEENEPICISASLAEPQSSPRLPVIIPLQRNYNSSSTTVGSTEFFRTDESRLSTKTLDEYKLPYYWDAPKGGTPRALVIAKDITPVDQKILYNHTRRLRLIQGDSPRFVFRPRNFDEPYFRPPEYVREAAAVQVETEGSASEKNEKISEKPAGQEGEPILKWPIKDYAPYLQKLAEKRFEDEPKRNESRDKNVQPNSSHRQRALLAYIHYHVIINSEPQFAWKYNNLPLSTKSGVESEVTELAKKSNLSEHVLLLLRSFVRRVSDILDYFVDKDYNCIVKGKIWAAIGILIQAFDLPNDKQLSDLHWDILSSPLRQIRQKILDLRDELSASGLHYIPDSMVEAFICLIRAFTEASHEASVMIQHNENRSVSESSDRSSHEEASIESSEGISAEIEVRGIERGSRSVRIDEPRRPSRLRADNASDSTEERSTSPSNPRAGRRVQEGEDSRTSFLEQWNQLLECLDDVRDECLSVFGTGDDAKETSYDVVDRGKIIALVMESVLRGHSTCPSIPRLNVEDIYTTYTIHLQLKVRNTPSKSLLVDLNLLREELEIIIAILTDQKKFLESCLLPPDSDEDDYNNDLESTHRRVWLESVFSQFTEEQDVKANKSALSILNKIKLDLGDQLVVFQELTTRVDRLERQVCQRVEIIEEDHGKAVLVFTIVSTIFLPLSFVTSYLGMNTSDIRDMKLTQSLFWETAVPFTVLVVSVVLGVAYNINHIMGWLARVPGLPQHLRRST